MRLWPIALGVVVLGGVAAVALAGAGGGAPGQGGIVWGAEECMPRRIDAPKLAEWLRENVRDLVVTHDVRDGGVLMDVVLRELAPEGCEFPPAGPQRREYDLLREQYADVYQQLVDQIWLEEKGLMTSLSFDLEMAVAKAMAKGFA